MADDTVKIWSKLDGFNIIGFFRGGKDFRNVDVPSLNDAVIGVHLDDAEQICGYLRNGNYIALVPEAAPDLLQRRNPEGVAELGGGPSLQSDGAWIWRQDLAYYFRVYNLALPDEFLVQIRASNYHVPSLTSVEDMRLHRWLAKNNW